MTIHVNIGEAKTRLSKLVAAAVRGEEIVVNRAGVPQVQLVAVSKATDDALARRAAKRKSAFGMYRDRRSDRDVDVPDLKLSDDEQDAEYRRKFGDPT